MATTTNKTEFQRYLNEFPKSVPALRSLFVIYDARPRGRGFDKNVFGYWVRVKYRTRFDRAYSAFWLRRPRLHGVIYQSLDPQIK